VGPARKVARQFAPLGMGSLGSSEPPACSAGFVRFLVMTLGQGGQCRYLRPCKEVSILSASPLLATHTL
jgi:hypothetical protein